MSVFQMSSAGKTGQPAMVGPDFDCSFGIVVVDVDGARCTVVVVVVDAAGWANTEVGGEGAVVVDVPGTELVDVVDASTGLAGPPALLRGAEV
jgi:hypothetical protein